MQNGMIVDKDGKVHFVTAGTKRLTIDENGNIIVNGVGKKISDSDGDTYIIFEETADEDKIHLYTAGVKRATIDENGNFSTADGKIDTSIADDSWHEVGADGEPAFQNGWVNYGGGFATAAFRKNALGWMHLKGMIKSGTIGSAAFVLPVGYRSPTHIYFACVSNGAFGDALILTSGNVIPQVGNNTWFSLNGITFYVGF